MQKYLLICTVLTLAIGARLEDLDYNPECNRYLNKFGTANNCDCAGASKIAFSGNAFFIGTTADVLVKLKYSDFEYFNDPKFKGLVIQDGKTLETTCLDLKLFKFAASDFSGGVEVNDLTITPSENLTEKQRFYSFTIRAQDFNKRLIETKNSNNFVYKGYYAIAYYASGLDQLQHTLYFDFTVILDKATLTPVNTAFKPFSLQATSGCTPTQSCDVNPDSSIQWCKDFTCTEFTQPDLPLDDQFVLLQTITKQGMNNYYLIECEVRYIGNGLNKKANIIQYDNTTPGQLKLLLNAEVVWKSFKIQVTGVLSTNPSGTKSQQEQTTFDTITGLTDEITYSDDCSTCEQECDANGFASDGCDICSSAQILYVLLQVLFVFVF